MKYDLMRPRPLPARLRSVAAMILPDARVADIGTGHGKLPVWLLEASRAATCIATERTRASAGELEALEGISGLEIRYGDGLRVLSEADLVDVLVLSGLGARSILAILEDAPARVAGVRRIVVQPQTEAGRVRRWLIHRGRTIVAERLTRDRGRFYVSIAADLVGSGLPDHPSLSEDDLLEAGPCLVTSRDPLVQGYWRAQAERLERILARRPAATARSRARRQADLAARVLAALPAVQAGSRSLLL